MASTTTAAAASAAATTASTAPNMCDFVTKAQLEAIAGRPNTYYEKTSSGLACRFRHEYKVEGEVFGYYEFNGSVTITRPSSSTIQATAMKRFRDEFADGKPYPCDVGDDCAVIYKGQGTDTRMNIGVFHVRFNAIVVRKQGASDDQNIKLAQERSVQLLKIIAAELATR